MSDPKKVKRRVVPTHYVDDIPSSPKGELKKSQWSTRTQDHFKGLHDKDAIQKIRERAVALGYEKERKPRSKSSSKRGDNENHGSHQDHLHSFSDYVKHFASMKNHSRGVTLLDYLKKNFDKHLYLSSKTKRFRRVQ